MTIEAHPPSSLSACFSGRTDLAGAARRLHAVEWDAIRNQAHPVETVETMLPDRPSIIPLLTLAGGLVGLFGSLSLPFYADTGNDPLDIGSPVLDGWQSAIPAAFENGALCAVLAGLFGFLLVALMPHPGRKAGPVHPMTARKGYVLAARTDTSASAPYGMARAARIPGNPDPA
jgi:hypothetical protein